jgi:hypothetical protein
MSAHSAMPTAAAEAAGALLYGAAGDGQREDHLVGRDAVEIHVPVPARNVPTVSPATWQPARGTRAPGVSHAPDRTVHGCCVCRLARRAAVHRPHRRVRADVSSRELAQGMDFYPR